MCIRDRSSGGKGWIRLKWKKSYGYKVDYFEVFRSTKRYSGYGTKAFYTTEGLSLIHIFYEEIEADVEAAFEKKLDA